MASCRFKSVARVDLGHCSPTTHPGQQRRRERVRRPHMLVKLTPGSYTVYARYKTDEQHRVVKVTGNGHEHVSFRFSIH
jgi:hypothetical protein